MPNSDALVMHDVQTVSRVHVLSGSPTSSGSAFVEKVLFLVLMGFLLTLLVSIITVCLIRVRPVCPIDMNGTRRRGEPLCSTS
ncbi:unnamed protein product [Protopolystoma xenopodis]|uniref:Uncharacterized protein n=1 Tax=Protopolystoma xenopodis TaxID=117903 RepID=A0A3S5CIQ4_9PLAT|nr:unnamed protein product [Protopolystoma xenopodis]